MTAVQLVQYLTWLVYIAIFLVGTIEAFRTPRRTNIDIALLFAVPAVIIADTILTSIGVLHASIISNNINGTLILSISYILLRLVSDFAVVPPAFVHAMGACLIVL